MHWYEWLDRHPVKSTKKEDTKRSSTAIHTLPIQATIDLHYCTKSEAIHELEYFLAKCVNEGKSKILVIHGKGYHSPNQVSVLSQFVKQFLHTHPLVRASGQAKQNNGGSGATWAVLRC